MKIKSRLLTNADLISGIFLSDFKCKGTELFTFICGSIKEIIKISQVNFLICPSINLKNVRDTSVINQMRRATINFLKA